MFDHKCKGCGKEMTIAEQREAFVQVIMKNVYNTMCECSDQFEDENSSDLFFAGVCVSVSKEFADLSQDFYSKVILRMNKSNPD